MRTRGVAVERNRRPRHDRVEVDRHLHRPADSRGGAERDVAGAEDLLVLEDLAGEGRLLVRPDSELGDGRAVGPVRRSGARRGAPLGAGGGGQVVALDGEPRRLGHAPDRAIEPSTTSTPSPPAGEMKPSPHGRFPNAPGSVSSPASGIAARPAEVEAKVGAVRAGDARLARGVERLGDRVRPSAAAPPCRRSSRGPACSSVTPGSVAARGAGVGGRLARRRVRERLDRSGRG